MCNWNIFYTETLCINPAMLQHRPDVSVNASKKHTLNSIAVSSHVLEIILVVLHSHTDYTRVYFDLASNKSTGKSSISKRGIFQLSLSVYESHFRFHSPIISLSLSARITDGLWEFSSNSLPTDVRSSQKCANDARCTQQFGNTDSCKPLALDQARAR